jgi:hypothetical protein
VKFLGVELNRFACFERQFVHLRPGLNLLVGKNNSGKTAILRALPLLRGALAAWEPTMEVPLGPYVRSPEAAPFFELAVIFELEQRDPPPFQPGGNLNWGEFVESRRPAVAYRFRMWAQANLLAFRRAELLVEGWRPVLLIEPTNQGPYLRLRPAPHGRREAPDGPLADENLGGQSGTIRNQPDGMRAEIGLAGPWFDQFNGLRRVRFVAPHRVAFERLPLATTTALSTNAADLTTYMQTLQANSRKSFQAVEEFVVGAYPDFERVNSISEGNQAAVTLTRRGTEEDIPLAYCGTGVEQLLALAAMVTASMPGELVLMDEPHSYLHPTAERALLEFLGKFPDRYFVIATHSSVLINGVTPDRLTYLQSPGTPYAPLPSPIDTSKVLHDLGYRNSDALFFDRLVVLEGPSDKEILRLLIALSGGVRIEVLQNTGFLSIDGINDSAREIQTKILRFEKLLEALGRAKMPRLYLLDGDRNPEDVVLLSRTKNPQAGQALNVKFLARTEIENYLLVPEAITRAMIEEASLLESVNPNPTLEAVCAKLGELLAADDERLFPLGHDRRMEQVKASRLLEKLYEHFGHLRYDKNRSGQVIARNLTNANAIGLDELLERLDILEPK